MYDTYRRANRGMNIVGGILGGAVALYGGYILITTPMTIGGHWGGITAVLAALGAVLIAEVPISWVSRRYQLDKPVWSPITWRVRRRWYGPHQPVTVDGRAGTAIDWTDEGPYGSRVWVLVMHWADGAALGDSTVEWRPLADLAPRRYVP